MASETGKFRGFYHWYREELTIPYKSSVTYMSIWNKRGCPSRESTGAALHTGRKPEDREQLHM
jgi:hypothetical protein